MRFKSLLWIAPVSLVLASLAGAEDPELARFFYVQEENIGFYAVEDIPGLGYAVLAGDPSMDGVYVIRMRIPANRLFPPHFHDEDRHITVLSGSWYFGTGESGKCSQALEMKRGAYVIHPKGAVHYEGTCTNRGAEIQVTGRGPVRTSWLQDLR
ncbi:MAG: cupin domain-containing protein [Pseudomonadota bacterium]